MAMKRLLRKLIWLLPIPAIIVAANWLTDPLHVFHAEDYLQPYVKTHLEGNPISCLAPDQRVFQKEYINMQRQPKDIVLLGTSRSRQVHAALFPNKTFYNHHLDGSSLADMLAIIALLEETNQLPQSMIIEMDPGLWQRDMGEEVLNPILIPAFNRMLETLDEPTGTSSLGQKWSLMTRKCKHLFSIANLKYGMKNTQKPPLTGDYPQQCNVKYADGSVSDYTGMQRTEAEILLFIRRYIDFRKAIPLQMKERHKRLFEKMITHLGQKDVKIMLYLPPIHPQAYRAVMQDSDQITTIKSYVDQFCKRENIQCFGDYNSSSFQLENHHYYDASHMSREGVTKVYQRYEALFSD